MSDRERSAGLVIGKVTAVKDLDGLGRIQVSYPFMNATEQRWIPVIAPMAGGGRGAFFMPEIDDEVAIAFDQGMWDHPYVIGFLWNPQQPAPSPDERQRMIRSRNGHAIRMVDSTPNSGNLGALVVEDGHGNSIVMTNGHITIKAVGKLRIEAADVTIMGRLVRPVGPAI